MHVYKPPPVGGLDRVPVYTAGTGTTRADLFELDGVTPMPGNVLVADTGGNLPSFQCATSPVYVGTSGSRTTWQPNESGTPTAASSAGQTITYGPFRIAHDTPGAADPAVPLPLLNLKDGDLLERVVVYVRTPFDGTNLAGTDILLGPLGNLVGGNSGNLKFSDDFYGGWNFSTGDGTFAGLAGGTGWEDLVTAGNVDFFRGAMRVIGDQQFKVALVDGNDLTSPPVGMTAGAMDIYIVVTTPAAPPPLS